MKNKLIATFILKNNILTTLELLKNEFKMNLNKVFIYNIENNDKEYLITFNISSETKINNILDNFTVVHAINKCIFSINALNQLISNDLLTDEEIPNISYQIDWSEMKNKLLLLSNNVLKIENIVKIEDKCVFFA